ncbi:MAG TPA: hypothetical protein VGP86_15145, partial [Xanthobacteraceae bacterium]|nr:hypothetical protein [Xanthobacteraceae bacterium]
MPAVATFGSIRVPALPTAWIDVDDEFNPDVPAEKDAQPAVYETTQREVVLPKLPADNGVTVKSETAPVNGHASANGHSALPKAGNVGEAYKVPENADIKV